MSDLIPLQVMDDESGKIVKVGIDTQRIAAQVHNQITMGTIFISAALAQMIDGRLFLGLGCGSRDEYIETMTPFSRRQAQKYYNVGKKILESFPQLKVQSTALLSNTTGEDAEKLNNLGALGIENLAALASIENADFSELAEGGTVKIGDEDLTVDQIRERSARDLAKKIQEVKAQYAPRLSKSEAEVLELKAEVKAYKKTLQEMETRVARIRDLETRYGEKASTVESKLHLIEQASSFLTRANEYLFKLDISSEDPQELQDQTLLVLRKLNVMAKMNSDNHTWLVEELDDL